MTAAAAVALIKKTDVFVPKSVWVELPPKDSLKPPPRPACSNMTAISASETTICNAIITQYNIPYLTENF
jgi:hypothetical protein